LTTDFFIALDFLPVRFAGLFEAVLLVIEGPFGPDGKVKFRSLLAGPVVPSHTSI